MKHVKTIRWQLQGTITPDHPAIQAAAALLLQDELIAFPTETVYGLGALADREVAVRKIFDVKGRPADNPLIVHVANHEAVLTIAQDIPEAAWLLLKTFTPGPLTLILKGKGVLSHRVTAGLNTVAVRIPDHPVALSLLTRVEKPVAAPSANRSGRPSPTRAEHVLEDFDGQIAGILDAGQTGYGLESTVLDMTVYPYTILRPGAVTLSDLQATIGADRVRLHPSLYPEKPSVVTGHTVDDDASDTVARSPGMKYRHYAPDVPLTLWLLNAERLDPRVPSVQHILLRLKAMLQKQLEEGLRLSFLVYEEDMPILKTVLGEMFLKIHFIHVGQRGQPEAIAASLYHTLRSLHPQSTDRAHMLGVLEDGVGLAVMNRLRKAASEIMTEEGSTI